MKNEIRQYAGLILKGFMERSFAELTDENIEYFIVKVKEIYSEANIIIKKTCSNLINTFVRLGGFDLWPKLLNFLLENLKIDTNYESTMDTIQIIIEDSGMYLENRNSNVNYIL